MKYFLAFMLTILAVGTSYGQQLQSTSITSKIPLATATDSGLVSREISESVVLSSSGTGSVSGTLYLSKVGKSVTISALAALTHTSSSTPSAAVGVIPAAYRPAANTSNVFLIGSSAMSMIFIAADGTLTFNYRDYAGTLINQAGTTFIPTISYVVQ